ncbi:MAG: PcfK-like protein [Bacteroides sp.]|nr:PcfK-like protein [Bacteroides sp.]
MNGTKAFQDTIAQYLMKRAENDPLVAVKLANPSKTMEQCCAYIIGEVKKSGCYGFTDDEIFGMAMHFWEEPEIEVGNAPANYRVVVNHVVELTDEEKAQARKEAIARLRDEEMAKMRKAKTTEKKVKEVQPSLFDF